MIVSNVRIFSVLFSMSTRAVKSSPKFTWTKLKLFVFYMFRRSKTLSKVTWKTLTLLSSICLEDGLGRDLRNLLQLHCHLSLAQVAGNFGLFMKTTQTKRQNDSWNMTNSHLYILRALTFLRTAFMTAILSAESRSIILYRGVMSSASVCEIELR